MINRGWSFPLTGRESPSSSLTEHLVHVIQGSELCRNSPVSISILQTFRPSCQADVLIVKLGAEFYHKLGQVVRRIVMTGVVKWGPRQARPVHGRFDKRSIGLYPFTFCKRDEGLNTNLHINLFRLQQSYFYPFWLLERSFPVQCNQSNNY